MRLLHHLATSFYFTAEFPRRQSESESNRSFRCKTRQSGLRNNIMQQVGKRPLLVSLQRNTLLYHWRDEKVSLHCQCKSFSPGFLQRDIFAMLRVIIASSFSAPFFTRLSRCSSLFTYIISRFEMCSSESVCQPRRH